MLRRQMGDAAGAGGRGVRQSQNRSRAENFGNILLGDVADEIDPRMLSPSFAQRLDISRRVGVVGAGDDQPGGGHAQGDVILESLDQDIATLVGAPLAESQNAVLGIAATRKIGILGPGRKNSMGTEMDVVPAVF